MKKSEVVLRCCNTVRPEEFKWNDVSLTKELRKLSNEDLLSYATMASKIRRDLSEWAAMSGYSKKVEQSDELAPLER